MPYATHSQHAPTGESAIRVISTNQYSSAGRLIGYPSNLDVYVRYISDADGSQTVQETRKVADLVGSRLYLHHRPLITSGGTITSITSSAGTIDSAYTNASQAYIVFSVLPTVDFVVSYAASPDCDFAWGLNTLQDSVMELEGVLGPSNDPTYPGIRNLKVGIFDSPEDSVASGVLQNAVHLSDLDRNIVIASSEDPTLQILRGDSHNIQIGRETDSVTFDVTGFTIQQSDGTKYNKIVLGSKTGDTLTWKGEASGAGPLTLGGPEWPIYSGKVFSVALTGSYYTGSMLRVHGDVAVMGNIKAVGNITVVNLTGTTSTVLGDWTIRDELFVEGESHLIGVTETNQLNVHQNLHISADIVADDDAGSGGGGQSLVDNLDCSEVAWTYRYITANRHPNTIIAAPMFTGAVAPKKVTKRPWLDLGPNKLVGDVFAITGQLNAAASSSGAHPHILQLLMNVGMISGTYSAFGSHSGTWSPGMMDPGATWIRMLNGPAEGLEAPIYGYTVEATGTLNTLTRLNVFLPEEVNNPPQTNNLYMLYNPGSVQYDTVSAAGGASPTFSIKASTTDPLAISFEDEVRIMTSNSANYSLLSALQKSISGQAGSSLTGIAYIYADSNLTDPENPPIFKSRPVPMRMPGQTAVGEVVATYNGSTWSILDTISYRPKGFYDSSWIPIVPDVSISAPSGRAVPGFSTSSTAPIRVYFHHNLGADVDISRISADLYLASQHAASTVWNHTHTPVYSMFGQDARNGHGLTGTFVHVPLGAKRTTSATSDRDASIFYIDTSLIGVDISPATMNGFPTGATSTPAPKYLRLVIDKNT